jgi:hypothetical protein
MLPSHSETVQRNSPECGRKLSPPPALSLLSVLNRSVVRPNKIRDECRACRNGNRYSQVVKNPNCSRISSLKPLIIPCAPGISTLASSLSDAPIRNPIVKPFCHASSAWPFNGKTGCGMFSGGLRSEDGRRPSAARSLAPRRKARLKISVYLLLKFPCSGLDLFMGRD